MFFKPNLSAVHLGFWYFVHGSLSKNITAVHLGFSNFVDGSLSENLTAVHLAFSNFMHGGLSENATAVHLGFSNFVHGSRSENLTAVHLAFLNFMHGSLFGNPTAVHLGFLNFIQSSVFENLTAVHLGFSNITYGCPSCRNGVKLPQSYGKWMHLQRNITHECLMNQSVFNGKIIFQKTEKIALLQVKALIQIIFTSSGLKKICALFYHPPVIVWEGDKIK